MSSLSLAYVPLRGEGVEPVLEINTSSDAHIRGLGIEGGQLVDPRPFVAMFPEDADQVGVFAEWVTHLAVLVDAGAGMTEIRAWLEDADPPVLLPAGDGRANCFEGRLSASTSPSFGLEAAVEAVRFLFEAEGVRLASAECCGGTMNELSDFLLLDADGSICAWVQLKEGVGDMTPTIGLKLIDRLSHRHAAFDYSAPTLRKQLQDWLAERGWYRPSQRTKPT
ncbi:hypothetical protein [Roseateles sp. L2-2]|uniref:hypothetical protein n=1 Tax=Roseateles sp. L2-2 TaxID=3422597 RepID=UPI003D35D8A9